MGEFNEPSKEDKEFKAEDQVEVTEAEVPASVEESEIVQPETFETPKAELVEFTDTLSNFLGAMHNRDQENLSPLMGEEEFGKIYGAGKALAEMSEQPQISYDQFYEAVQVLSNNLQDFGKTSGAVRDDVESVQHLARAFWQMEQVGSELSKKFAQGKDQRDLVLAKEVDSLAGIADEKKRLLQARINLMEEY